MPNFLARLIQAGRVSTLIKDLEWHLASTEQPEIAKILAVAAALKDSYKKERLPIFDVLESPHSQMKEDLFYCFKILQESMEETAQQIIKAESAMANASRARSSFGLLESNTPPAQYIQMGIEQAQIAKRSVQLLSCIIGVEINPSRRKNLAEIYAHLDNAMPSIQPAMLDLKRLEETRQKIYATGDSVFSELEIAHWISCCTELLNIIRDASQPSA